MKLLKEIFPWLLGPAALIIGVSWLYGCAMVAQQAPRCPTVHAWTKEQEKKMAAELAVLPSDDILVDAFKDYARLRNEARACF